MRRARELSFNIKLKTNAILIRKKEAKRLRELGVENVQISFSHRPEVHDAITKVPGSLNKAIKAIRFLVSRGLKVTMANVLMRGNRADYPDVQKLAAELGASFTIDPTITPHINGDRSLLALNIPRVDLEKVMREPALVGDVDEFCAPPQAVDEDAMDVLPPATSLLHLAVRRRLARMDSVPAALAEMSASCVLSISGNVVSLWP